MINHFLVNRYMVPRSLCIRLHTCGALVFERITTKMDDGEKKKRKKERKKEKFVLVIFLV